MAVLLWAKKTGRPYIVTPHGMLDPWIMARSPWLKKLVSLLYQDRFLRGAAALHVGSERDRRYITAEFGPLPIRIAPPNYIPPVEPETDSMPPSWYRSDFAGRDIYLFLGRIHEKKGCGELLEAWNRLCEKDRSFRDRSVLVFCGWLDAMKSFPELVEAVASRHSNVLYAGPQYGLEKRRSFEIATFFALPSKTEGLPVAVLEAWSAGKPVLMTAECNLEVGFERGAAIPIGQTASEIEEGLKVTGALTPDERQAMGEAGRELVAGEYSRSVVANAFAAIYRDAIVVKGKPQAVGIRKTHAR